MQTSNAIMTGLPLPERSSQRLWSGLRLVAEGLLVATLIATSFWYGRLGFLHTVTPPDYFYLAPAVMVASGQGFTNPVPTPGSPLARFFARQSEALAFADVKPASVGAPDAFHSATRYLLLSIGYWWRVTGITWSGLADVAAALHVLAVLGAYAALRLFLPVPLALVGGLWTATSTLQLSFVPHVRDYSKAAFILAALPLVIALALKSKSRRALLLTAAASGLVIGVGIGFRMDVGIMIPLALAAIIGFRGSRPWRALTEKTLACAVFAVGLWLPAWPVVSQLASEGSNESHVVLLGYADPFEVGLDVDRSVYGFLPFYSDGYVGVMVRGYASSFSAEPFAIPSPAYAAASRAMWLDLMRNFPADVYARALAAVNVVMNLVFRSPDPTFLDKPPPATAAAVAFYTWLNRFDGCGAALGLLFLVIAFGVSVSHGLLATTLTLILAGYPSLQFSGRHYFHVQFVPVLAILVVVNGVVLAAVWVIALRRGRPAQLKLRPVALRVAIGLTCMAAMTVVPLLMLRAYQRSHFQELLTPVLSSLRSEVAPELLDEPNGSSLLRWRDPTPAKTSGNIQSAYYLLEFDDQDATTPIVAGLRYQAASAEMDFSRVLAFDPSPGVNRLGFAVLTVAGQSSFEGVELGQATRRRLARVYRVLTDGPARLPMDLLLPADWQTRPLFQRLVIENTFALAPQRTVLCASGPGCKGMLGAIDRLDALGAPDSSGATAHAAIAAMTPLGITVDGVVENDSSYLVQLAARPAPGGSAFVAEGWLGQGGGVVVGLLKEMAWYRQAFIKTPGHFVVVVPVDGPGAYVPLITNAMSPGRRRNHVTITRAGFIDPPAAR